MNLNRQENITDWALGLSYIETPGMMVDWRVER